MKSERIFWRFVDVCLKGRYLPSTGTVFKWPQRLRLSPWGLPPGWTGAPACRASLMPYPGAVAGSQIRWKRNIQGSDQSSNGYQCHRWCLKPGYPRTAPERKFFNVLSDVYGDIDFFESDCWGKPTWVWVLRPKKLILFFFFEESRGPLFFF